MVKHVVQDRFQRYRGLKSMRTSEWDPREGLPREYTHIFAFDNFARARKLAKQARERTLQVRSHSVARATSAIEVHAASAIQDGQLL